MFRNLSSNAQQIILFKHNHEKRCANVIIMVKCCKTLSDNATLSMIKAWKLQGRAGAGCCREKQGQEKIGFSGSVFLRECTYAYVLFLMVKLKWKCTLKLKQDFTHFLASSVVLI